MQVILVPTEAHPKSQSTHCLRVTVSVAAPTDDLTIDEVWENLLRPALIAYGYAPESIDAMCEG